MVMEDSGVTNVTVRLFMHPVPTCCTNISIMAEILTVVMHLCTGVLTIIMLSNFCLRLRLLNTG